MKNYELLGRKWDYYMALPQLLEKLREDDARHGAFRSPVNASERIRRKVMYPALQHLGFGPVDGVREQVEHGVDLAVEYFSGRPKGLDRQRPWFEALTSALFLGGLVGRWDDLGTIGAWFDARIEPEYTAGEIEDEYQQLFICIAGSLTSSPLEGGEELLAKVKKCRTKRPRLMCAAWEAANSGDQATFNKAFSETVKHFLSKPQEGQVYDWLAIDQSSVWLMAERRGLQFPPLSAKQAAAVVTRQSAGLAE